MKTKTVNLPAAAGATGKGGRSAWRAGGPPARTPNRAASGDPGPGVVGAGDGQPTDPATALRPSSLPPQACDPARDSRAGRPRSRSARAPRWQLRLYVLGQTAKSRTAFANLKRHCEHLLQGRYRITVIDLAKQPHRARSDQILAIPTVVRRLPKPVRILIGTLSDPARVLLGLDLRATE